MNHLYIHYGQFTAEYKNEYFQNVIDAMKDGKSVLVLTSFDAAANVSGSYIYTPNEIENIANYTGSIMFKAAPDYTVANDSGDLYFRIMRPYIHVYVESGTVTDVGYISYDYSRNGLVEVLTKTNTTAFTPTGDYNPATKKYVDEAVASVSGGSGGEANLTNYYTKAEVDALLQELRNEFVSANNNINDKLETIIYGGE